MRALPDVESSCAVLPTTIPHLVGKTVGDERNRTRFVRPLEKRSRTKVVSRRIARPAYRRRETDITRALDAFSQVMRDMICAKAPAWR